MSGLSLCAPQGSKSAGQEGSQQSAKSDWGQPPAQHSAHRRAVACEGHAPLDESRINEVLLYPVAREVVPS